MQNFKITIFVTLFFLIKVAFSLNTTSYHYLVNDSYRLSNQCHENIKRIKVALDYMYDNIESVNLDAFFGVLVAKSYLKNIQIKSHELDEVLMLSDEILKLAKNVDLSDFYHLQNIQKYFMNEDNWKELIHTSNKNFKCKIRNNKFNYLSENEIVYKLLSPNASPNELESDMCLSEIITRKTKKDDSCRISNGCYRAMIADPSTGYSETHRLLYFLICYNKKCRDCGGKSIRNSIQKLCCNIMEEALVIEKIRFPLPLRDLLMEQVVLCSMSGYIGILKHKWTELVKYWQKSEGCWGYYMRLNSNKRKSKRSDSSLGPAGCSSHSTGLGIALLAIAINKSLCSLETDSHLYE